ncbi:MAG TPA: glycosyltransferase [Caulobacterales bacterium]|nr:glycosyltransferase [Caulobacterales bacterium]
MRTGKLQDEQSAMERAERAARFSLAHAAPILSARRRFYITQIMVLLILSGVCLAALLAAPLAIRIALFVLFSVFTLWRLLAAASALSPPAPDAPASTGWQGELPIYTILCPLYREANMVEAIAGRLRRLDYPANKLDLKIVLEADDADTLNAAKKIEWPAQAEIIVVPAGTPRTKPKALNYALTFARGQFVTIYDAEDAPDPRQLRAALDAFAAGGEDMGCVQAPLLIDGDGGGWISSQFAAEYAVQFLTLMPFLARLGAPLMLGGTSNHFRASALSAAGAWDPFNVTEDADIGYRLARDGWRLGAITPPTWEEAPARLWPWLRQRTRWIKGHIQTWLVLMRDPPATMRELGASGFFAMQIMLGGSIVSAFAHGPIFAALAYALVSPTFNLSAVDWSLALAGYATAAYSVTTASVVLRDRRIALAALTMPLYWPLSTIAALMAALDLAIRPHYWAKTEHGLSTRSSNPA